MGCKGNLFYWKGRLKKLRKVGLHIHKKQINLDAESRFNMNTLKRYVRGIDVAFIILFSIALMLLMMAFKSHLFLSDDNYTQFFPVIEKVYETFITKGRLPQLDFNQMRGMLIGDEGYYGQMNPLLFIAWLLSHFFNISDCVDVYAIICVTLGNIAWNQLLKKCEYKCSVRFVVIAMTTASACFFWSGYWFYVFNCYISIPLLLHGCYMIVASGGLASYVLAGFSLFFCLSLGNAQYTFYCYVIFAIIMAFYIIASRNYKQFWKFISNIIVALALSGPILFLQLGAGSRRSEIVGSMFLTGPVGIIQQFVFSFLPYNWVEKIIGESDSFSFLNENSVNTHIFSGFLFISVVAFLACWYYDVFRLELQLVLNQVKAKKREHVFLFILVFLLLIAMTHNAGISLFYECTIILIVVACASIRNKSLASIKASDDSLLLFVRGGVLAITFLLILEMGKGYGIADLLSAIPFINQFNYLSKISFILTPLMAFVAAYMLNIIKHNKYIIILCACFVALGIYNNHYISSSNTHPHYNEWSESQCDEFLQSRGTLVSEFLKNGMDIMNYRFLPFITDDENDTYGDYPDAGLLTSNHATFLGLYELGGYEMAYTQAGYSSSDAIFPSKGFSYARTSAVSSFSFFKRCMEDPEYARKAVSQMIMNGARYCVFNNGSPYIDDFEDFIGSDERVKIARMIALSNDTTIFEIDGVDRLFSSASVLEFSSMDEIILQSERDVQDNVINSSFSYFDNLHAYYLDDSGEKVPLLIEEDDQGNAVIKGNSIDDKTIHLLYEDEKQSWVLYYGMVASFLAMVFMGIFLFKKN